MSKKTSKPRQLEKARGPKRPKAIVITGTIMSLLLASVALGQWGGFFATKQKRNLGQQTTVTTQSLNDLSPPSKEYIYAGGRLIATEEPTPQGGTNNAAFISQSVQTSMTAGQSYGVTVTMSNTGTATWTAGSYSLGSQNPPGNTTWGVSQVGLSTVPPGSQNTFSFNVTAPSIAGTYNFQWQMQQNGVGYFGALTTNMVISVSAGGGNNAAFVSQLPPPSTMTPGQTASVSVTMSNSGTTTWTTSSYSLGSQNPQGNTNWGLNQIGLATTVSPGFQATISFTVTAPTTPGTYNFQWQMQQNGLGYFGALTTNVVVTVASGGSNNAAFVSHVPPPSTMTPSQTASVSVTMSNNGTATWAPGTYFLGSLNPQGNSNWGLSQVSLISSVEPGAQRQFSFTATAPSIAGTYNFQWGMFQSGVGYFGTPSTNILVTVAANPCTGGSACPTVSKFSGSDLGSPGYKNGNADITRWRAPVDGVVGKDPLLQEPTLYVVDSQNHCIRKINLSTQISDLVAGTPNSAGYFENGSALSAKYNYPRGITAIKDANGVITTLLIADTDNHVIRKLQWTTNQWVSSKLSGMPGEGGESRDGDADTCSYSAPQGITYASDGFIYVADTGALAVRKVDLVGYATTVIPQGAIGWPVGISAREGNGSSPLLYISGQQDHNIWRWDPAGGVVLLAGSGTPNLAEGVGAAASFNYPGHLAWACTSSGEVLYIADRNNQRIRKLVLSSSTVSTYAGFKKGFVNGSCTVAWFFLPSGVARGPGGEVYVMDTTNNVIRKAL